jgi:hypothetical protein
MTSDDHPEVSSFPVGRKTQWMGAARPWMWCGLADVVRPDWPTCRTTSHQKLAREDKAKPERTGIPSYCPHSKFQVVLCSLPTPSASYRDTQSSDSPKAESESASSATRRSHVCRLIEGCERFSSPGLLECLSGKTVSPNSPLSQRLPITGRLMCVTRRGPPSNPMECSLTGALGLQFGEPQTWASEALGEVAASAALALPEWGYGFVAGGEAERPKAKS